MTKNRLYWILYMGLFVLITAAAFYATSLR